MTCSESLQQAALAQAILAIAKAVTEEPVTVVIRHLLHVALARAWRWQKLLDKGVYGLRRLMKPDPAGEARHVRGRIAARPR